MIASRKTRLLSALGALAVAFTMVTVDAADARRGGSFGSRGSRTFDSAPATNTAPSVAPVQRSTTQPGAATQRPAAGAATPAVNRPSFGGNLMRGLMIGGLVGLLMGSGFGGLAGMLGFLVQALLLALVVMLAIRFFRSRSSSPAMAGGRPQGMQRSQEPNGGQSYGIPGIGSRAAMGGGSAARRPVNRDELGIGENDLNTFERRLTELQDAYSREDYATLDRIATPEMVSYLAEELARNASQGLRNEVSDVSLLQGDVAESWREANSDYATVAMRYSSRDVTRERTSGRVVSGNEQPSESTEIWTFLRERGGEWKLSAIQEA
ncbi:Tim44 domain-containing protein [Aureimonas psammosilenae]|uniref:Tim44 domain-containing protein n=1 Tax=Aureimonas psammosilenae TaxID=2495496 RepID=UPI00126118B7|nr:Tim44 domain-containing protein [Aureimonas psammosilenae]